MSTTKPPAGYDDKFVVPLEPSRRGAHRARVSPVIGFLPAVAVVTVVLLVVVMAWTLIGKSGGGSSTNATQTAAAGQAQQTGQPAPGNTVTTPPASGAATTPAPGASTAVVGGVDKATAVSVLNSTTRTGLARKAATTLTGKGWTAAKFAATPKVAARTTTTVYYPTTAQKAVAEALVADLGVGTARRSTLFGVNAITVVLGSDYPA
jgi:hypothetical protein